MRACQTMRHLLSALECCCVESILSLQGEMRLTLTQGDSKLRTWCTCLLVTFVQAGQGRAGQGRAGQGRAGQRKQKEMAGQGRACCSCATQQIETGQGRAGHGGAKQQSGQDRAGQGQAEPGRAMQGTRPGRAAQDTILFQRALSHMNFCSFAHHSLQAHALPLRIALLR